jgi:hypothetical protein
MSADMSLSWVAHAVVSVRMWSLPSTKDSGLECAATSRPMMAPQRAKAPCTRRSFSQPCSATNLARLSSTVPRESASCSVSARERRASQAPRQSLAAQFRRTPNQIAGHHPGDLKTILGGLL